MVTEIRNLSTSRLSNVSRRPPRTLSCALDQMFMWTFAKPSRPITSSSSPTRTSIRSPGLRTAASRTRRTSKLMVRSARGPTVIPFRASRLIKSPCSRTFSSVLSRICDVTRTGGASVSQTNAVR